MSIGLLSLRDNGVDIDASAVMAMWYGMSLEQYLTGQDWTDENLSSN
jgi:hypothetical protein